MEVEGEYKRERGDKRACMAMVLEGSKCGKGQDGAVGENDMMQSLHIVQRA